MPKHPKQIMVPVTREDRKPIEVVLHVMRPVERPPLSFQVTVTAASPQPFVWHGTVTREVRLLPPSRPAAGKKRSARAQERAQILQKGATKRRRRR